MSSETVTTIADDCEVFLNPPQAVEARNDNCVIIVVPKRYALEGFIRRCKS